MKDHDLANLRILDAFAQADALDAAERGTLLPELRADVKAIGDAVRALLAELRRRDLASAALRPPAAAVVRPSILEMARDALVARLAQLRAMHPDSNSGGATVTPPAEHLAAAPSTGKTDTHDRSAQER